MRSSTCNAGDHTVPTPTSVARVPARAPLPPVTLTGAHVRLEPLSREHVDALTTAAMADRSTYTWTSVPNGRAAMQHYVEGLLADQVDGEVLPFVQRSAATGQVVGCTRYLEPRWFSGRPLPDEIEVGGTWLTAAVQRTALNTEAKLLLFTHAFEEYGVWRLALVTDVHNARSRAAIERVGARFEGVLRNHRRYSGVAEPEATPRPRDTAVYSITREEWPTVKADLKAKLGRP